MYFIHIQFIIVRLIQCFDTQIPFPDVAQQDDVAVQKKEPKKRRKSRAKNLLQKSAIEILEPGDVEADDNVSDDK